VTLVTAKSNKGIAWRRLRALGPSTIVDAFDEAERSPMSSAVSNLVTTGWARKSGRQRVEGQRASRVIYEALAERHVPNRDLVTARMKRTLTLLAKECDRARYEAIASEMGRALIGVAEGLREIRDSMLSVTLTPNPKRRRRRRRSRANRTAVAAPPSLCKKGHANSDPYVDPRGNIHCRECRRIAALRYERRSARNA